MLTLFKDSYALAIGIHDQLADDIRERRTVDDVLEDVPAAIELVLLCAL